MLYLAPTSGFSTNLELRVSREAGGHHRAIDDMLPRLFDETLYRIPELPSAANGLVRGTRLGMPSMHDGFETGVVGSLPVDPSDKCLRQFAVPNCARLDSCFRATTASLLAVQPIGSIFFAQRRS